MRSIECKGIHSKQLLTPPNSTTYANFHFLISERRLRTNDEEESEVRASLSILHKKKLGESHCLRDEWYESLSGGRCGVPLCALVQHHRRRLSYLVATVQSLIRRHSTTSARGESANRTSVPHLGYLAWEISLSCVLSQPYQLFQLVAGRAI